MNVTLNRTYAPASSHGTVLINFSVIIHWLKCSAFSNVTRCPSLPTADLGDFTYRKNEALGFFAFSSNQAMAANYVFTFTTGTPPSITSRLDADFEASDMLVYEASALDEVFVQLSDGRLRSRHDAWDEPQTDWRDMTLAVAAVLATRPAAPRRRRPAAAGGR